jgi:4-hydroxybenzoate polyprenyltransferase
MDYEMAKVRDYIEILRPSHWTKNVFVFAGLLFGKKWLAPPDEALVAVGQAVVAFAAFCLASSAVYIFNDLVDRQTDRLHPYKGRRPISSGRIAAPVALALSGSCALAAIGLGMVLVRQLGIIVLTYLALMVVYSLALKRVMILDCIVISVGFCLRAMAGAVAVGVFISLWLVVCTFALCLFIAFGKRRGEMAQLGEDGGAFRQTLSGYTPELLAHMLDVTSGLAIVCFLLYATDAKTRDLFGSNALVYTTPMVLFCVFRFSAQIQKGACSGPVEFILKDVPFQIGLVLWMAACVGIVYAGDSVAAWLPCR